MTYDDWQALKQDCFAALHCALPGNVLSFNPETQTAEIRPAVKNFPTLPDVPVFMPVPCSMPGLKPEIRTSCNQVACTISPTALRLWDGE